MKLRFMIKCFKHSRTWSIINRWNIILWLIIVYLTPSAVLADCLTPRIADPWFVEQLTVGDVAIIPSVVIRSADLEVVIENNSASPLYIVERVPDLHPSIAEHQPFPIPPDTIVSFKITSSRVFYWGTVDPYKSPEQGWKDQEKKALVLPLSYLFEDRNRREDNRPPGVVIPAVQRKDIILIYEGRQVPVPISLTYQLNPNYDPHQLQNVPSCRSDFGYGRALLLVWGMGICTVTLTVMLGGCIVWQIRKFR